MCIVFNIEFYSSSLTVEDTMFSPKMLVGWIMCVFVVAKGSPIPHSNAEAIDWKELLRDALLRAQSGTQPGDLTLTLSPTLINHTTNEFSLISRNEATVFADSSGFRTVSIDVTSETTTAISVSIVCILPVVTLKGQYQLDGHLLRLVPLYGEGPFSVTVETLQLTFDAHVPKTDDAIVATGGSAFLFDQGYGASFGNFLGGGMLLSTATSKLLPILGKVTFDAYQNQIALELRDILVEKLNAELAHS